MKPSDFLRQLGETERAAFAASCGSTAGHLRNVAFSGKPCGVLLAVQWERESQFAVRRWDLRPGDWHRIWPELVGTEGAPAVEVRDAA
jgi:hypothetical protein